MCKYVKFADDLTVKAHSSKTQPNDHLQEELDHILKWSERKKMKLNTKKTEELLIQKGRHDDPPRLLANGVEVCRVDATKILGIKFDNGLTFKTHVGELIKKLNSKLYLLKQLKNNGYNTEELQYFYTSVIISSMTYGYGAWCCAANTTVSALEIIRKRAEKISAQPLHGGPSS